MTPATRGGNCSRRRKVRATLHWSSASHAVPAEIRLYNPLSIQRARPRRRRQFRCRSQSPLHLEILTQIRVEPALAAAVQGEAVQFERQGYFCADLDSTAVRLAFNRTVGLRDSWAKARASGG